jgi:hypothetical protein
MHRFEMKVLGGASALLLALSLTGCGPTASPDMPEGAGLGQYESGVSNSTGSMNQGRFDFTTTLLANGRVLVVGGQGISTTLASAELYDPATGTFSLTGSMGTGRTRHAAVRLADGRVLVAGGMNADSGNYHSAAFVYDPATGSWNSTGAMPNTRADHSATLLPDGRVLIAGGFNVIGSLSASELYNPDTNTFSAIPGWMNSSRHGHTALLLQNGKVLVAGGSSTASAELYDPATSTWIPTGTPAVARRFAASFLLADGRVLVAGGENPSTGSALNSAEIYDPTTGTWSSTGPMNQARKRHAGALLPSGKVVLLGGINTARLSSIERFDPATNSWSTVDEMTRERSNHGTMPLNNGKVLVIGGNEYGSIFGVTAELYTDNNSSCIPTTCAAQGKNCGTIADGCGGALSCGSCASGETCSSSNVCVAQPPPANPGTASYDAVRRAPGCASAASACDSMALLYGRGSMGPESNAPNTLGASCQDGSSGTYHSDESLDRLKVSTLDGSTLASGKTVRIDATVWAWGSGSSDALDLYYTANALSPSWTYLATLRPSAGGQQVLSASYTLPAGTLQAVRGVFRYGGSVGSCVSGSYNDHDDLFFVTQ